MKRIIFLLMLVAPCLSAFAYPEFQRFSQDHSGRPINCAMCHASGDGPEGAGRGQIGSLTPDELNRLNAARGAFAAGVPVESPILNEFGNNIIYRIGKTKFLELRAHPEQLAEVYGYSSDLDGDGISDAQEYLDGTQPLNGVHGNPWKLFLHNLSVYKLHVIMLALATLAGLWGLSHLLYGLADRTRSVGSEEIRN
jgi:hypothetical protein